MRKKTHEEYVKEVAEKAPNVEVIGQYINAKTKITHRCKIHNVIWDSLSSNILRGKGCQNCLSDKLRDKNLKTEEQYINEIAVANPNVKLIGSYKGATIATTHRCLIHNIDWEPMPCNVIKGCGCPNCKSERISVGETKSNDEYITQLSNILPHIKPLEPYAGVDTPILHYCNIHERQWKAKPCNILKGKGCPSCSKESQIQKRALTQLEYAEQISSVLPHIRVVGDYINNSTPILHYCNIHDFYWNAIPANLRHGIGCPECVKEVMVKKSSLSQDDYVAMLKKDNPNVILIGEYVSMKAPTLHKCIRHDVIWETTPGSTLQGCGCQKCKSEKISLSRTKTTERYIKDVNIVNPDIIVLDKYINVQTPIKHQCRICGSIWSICPDFVLNGTGCPDCKMSRGEHKICNILDSLCIKYIRQYKDSSCKNIRPLPFDFYIPSLNKMIEFDGRQHYMPVEYFGGEEAFKNQQINDQIKTDYCKSHDIPLLRIPYWDFDNIETILKQFLFD